MEAGQKRFSCGASSYFYHQYPLLNRADRGSAAGDVPLEAQGCPEAGRCHTAGTEMVAWMMRDVS